MSAKRKEPEEAAEPDTINAFDAARFRLFITAAMRAVLIVDAVRETLRDIFGVLDRASNAAAATPNASMPCSVISGPRRLDACLALPEKPPAASVLLLHGIGERLEYWSAAQQLLAGRGIASLIIDYSGYGVSEGAITPSNLRQDALAGYAELQRLVPAPGPPFVLGLSLGTGVAVDAAPHFHPAPSGVILCEAFSSLRDAAAAVCNSLPLLKHISSALARLMPDLYRTASSIGKIGAPVLIVHSDADKLFPAAMAFQIYAAVTRSPVCRARLAFLSGYAHNDAYLRPSAGYWEPVFGFIGELTGRQPAQSHEPPAVPKS